jgi:hypothetical protein
LVDLGAGDFDIKGNLPSRAIDVDGEFTLGVLGDGMQNAGNGCNGCSGCNVNLNKSKIRDHMNKT